MGILKAAMERVVNRDKVTDIACEVPQDKPCNAHRLRTDDSERFDCEALPGVQVGFKIANSVRECDVQEQHAALRPWR